MLSMELASGAATRFVSAADPSFPSGLLDLASIPRGIWVTGSVPDRPGRVVAIVGSRGATRAAAARVEAIAADLAAGRGDRSRGGDAWQVVSGGALGIDAAAHRGALSAGGQTFAVLGCGIDVVYPDRHASLFREIAMRGGLLSEYAPGTQPRHGQFPARNRLVAALADAVIVGEAQGRSGALITARLGRALGRPLFAVPGSAGTDGLLARGEAAAVESAADVLTSLAGGRPPRALVPAALEPVCAALAAGPQGPEALARQLGWPLGRALAALAEAELMGIVARAAGGRFEARLGN